MVLYPIVMEEKIESKDVLPELKRKELLEILEGVYDHVGHLRQYASNIRANIYVESNPESEVWEGWAKTYDRAADRLIQTLNEAVEKVSK